MAKFLIPTPRNSYQIHTHSHMACSGFSKSNRLFFKQKNKKTFWDISMMVMDYGYCFRDVIRLCISMPILLMSCIHKMSCPKTPQVQIFKRKYKQSIYVLLLLLCSIQDNTPFSRFEKCIITTGNHGPFFFDSINNWQRCSTKNSISLMRFHLLAGL